MGTSGDMDYLLPGFGVNQLCFSDFKHSKYGDSNAEITQYERTKRCLSFHSDSGIDSAEFQNIPPRKLSVPIIADKNYAQTDISTGQVEQKRSVAGSSM